MAMTQDETVLRTRLGMGQEGEHFNLSALVGGMTTQESKLSILLHAEAIGDEIPSDYCEMLGEHYFMQARIPGNEVRFAPEIALKAAGYFVRAETQQGRAKAQTLISYLNYDQLTEEWVPVLRRLGDSERAEGLMNSLVTAQEKAENWEEAARLCERFGDTERARRFRQVGEYMKQSAPVAEAKPPEPKSLSSPGMLKMA